MLICSSIILTSCEGMNNQNDSETTTSVMLETIAPPSSEKETGSTVEIEDYDVNPLMTEFSFDDFLDKCVDLLDEKDPRTSDKDDDSQIDYFPDYSVVIENELEPDSGGEFSIPEYEYHVTRYFQVGSIRVDVLEFDSNEWAEKAFRFRMDSLKLKSEDYALYDYASEGYFFSRYQDSMYYNLEYYAGNCVVIFRTTSETINQLDLLLELCDMAGLPVLEEVKDLH